MSKGFSGKVKMRLAGRAGHCCSMPKCENMTIGPTRASEGFTLYGEGAHIYSQRTGGPRYDSSMTSAELNSATNGIWVCPTCHTIIDKNNGADYSALQLKGYKKLHEQKIYNRIHRVNIPIFWIYEMAIGKNKFGFSEQQIIFSKLNIITGANGVGKSLLVEFLLGVFDSRKFTRWSLTEMNYRITFFNPEEHLIDVTTEKGKVIYSEDKIEYPINPYHISILTAMDFEGAEDISRLDKLASAMNVTPSELAQWVSSASFKEGILIKNVKIEKSGEVLGDEEIKFYFQTQKSKEHNAWIPYNLLSGTEQKTFIIDFAIQFAQFLSQYRNIVLLIDGGIFNSLERIFKDAYFAKLDSQQCPFQSIVILADSIPAEWKVYRVGELKQGSLGKELIWVSH